MRVISDNNPGSPGQAVAAAIAAVADIDMQQWSFDVPDSLSPLLSATPEDARWLRLAADPLWPVAVPKDLLIHTHEERITRAEVITRHYLKETLRGKKVLDFGCFDDAFVRVADRDGATLAVGYDVSAEGWVGRENDAPGKMTTSWDEVTSLGPFDVVIAFDVVDHMTTHRLFAYREVHKVLANGGRFYVRGHPWYSRHGGHAYKVINKAFLHLFVSEKLAMAMASCQGPIHPDWSPPASYELLATTRTPLKATHVNHVVRPVEGWFGNNEMLHAKLANNPLSKYSDKTDLVSMLEVEFVDIIFVK